MLRKTQASPGVTPPARVGRAPRPRARRALAAAAWALAVVAGFAVYLRLARTRAVNSDGSGVALQGWDMLHGNLLLHGWRLGDVFFYTTEVPQYALVEDVRGLGQDVVHVAAAMTYTLAVLFAALLAKGNTSGRAAAARAGLAAGIMIAPQLGSGTNVLLSSPDHIGTSVPVLAAWLILDRMRFRWYVPVIAGAALAWALAADEIVLLIGVLPLLAVSAARAGGVLLVARRRRAGNGGLTAAERQAVTAAAGLMAAAIVAGIIGMAAPHVIHAAGGFSAQPLGARLAPLRTIAGRNLRLTGEGLLLLGGADFLGLAPGAGTYFVMLHVAGVAVAACAVGCAARRFFRGDDLVAELLLAGIVLNVAAYALGTRAVILPDTREMAPVLPLAAALAGRELPRFAGGVLARLADGGLPGPARRAPAALGRALGLAVGLAVGLVLAGYLAGLGLELTAPEPPAQNAALTAWLEGRHLGTGLSGYWEANVVSLTSGNRVNVRPVSVAGGKVVAYGTVTKAEWFDPADSRADFVVLAPAVPGYPGFADRAAVIATFGPPARTYRAGPYTILWWRKNLLADLGG